jgi:lactate dehydrogenase-like 2-hydroxyacid dehydrogenase
VTRIASIAYDIDLDTLDAFAAATPLVAANRSGDAWPGERSHPLLSGLDGVLVGARDRVDRAFLDAASDTLKVVASNSVGFDHMLGAVDLARERGIALTHTPQVLTAAVAEQTFAFLATFLRWPWAGHAAVLAGGFVGERRSLLASPGFDGTTLGVVGVGEIGAEVARRAAVFGMKVLGNDIDPGRPTPFVRRTVPIEVVDLATLLARADVVSLHVDLNPSSHHLVGRAQLECMRPTAGLVNTSRGAVVDEEALARALGDGVIAWAALDVFENEPRVHPGLLALAAEGVPGRAGRVLFAPHVASGTRRARRAMAGRAIANLTRALAGADPATLDLIPPLRASLGPADLERLRRRLGG